MNSNKTHIAVVDDHTLMRSGLISIIQTFDGYAVSFDAGNGKEFIEQLANSTTPDIVLLDINMPVMDGFATADWIRQNLPLAKVLVLSVTDKDTVIIGMLKKGARGYILKDSKPATFKQAIDSVRDTGYYINELVSNKMFSYVLHEDEKGKETSMIASLSPNERIFLQLVCTEMTYKEIAQKMKVSPRTVDGYRDDLLKKLKVQSRIGLVIFAIKYGIHTIN